MAWPWEIVTPDGITETGKKFIWEKLAWKFTPEEIKDVISTIDTASRTAMLNSDNKIANAFKRALPLIDSTSEKMSNEYATLFKKQIPADIQDMKSQIQALALKKY